MNVLLKDLILFVPSCSNKKMYVGQTLHCCKFTSNNRIELCYRIMRPLAVWMLRSNDLRFTCLCKEAFKKIVFVECGILYDHTEPSDLIEKRNNHLLFW